MKAKEHTAKM